MKTPAEADDLAQSLTEFISLVAHELRAPAAGILAHAWTVDQYWDSLSAEERRHSVQSIARRAQRLERLIRNLLTYSRLETGIQLDLSLRDVDLRQVIEKASGELQEEHRGRQIQLELPERIPVVADEDRTEQVLVNLIENAFKFSPEDAPVVVRVGGEPRHVEIQVIDRGSGIPQKDIPLLFRRFSRLRSTGGDGQSGTGIGLYLSKTLVEAQGGKIWVTSEEGAGSVFSFTLPRPRSKE